MTSTLSQFEPQFLLLKLIYQYPHLDCYSHNILILSEGLYTQNYFDEDPNLVYCSHNVSVLEMRNYHNYTLIY